MADAGSDDAEASPWKNACFNAALFDVFLYVLSNFCPSVGIRARGAARFKQHPEADQSWNRRNCNSNRCSNYLTVCTGVCSLIVCCEKAAFVGTQHCLSCLKCLETTHTRCSLKASPVIEAA